MSKLIFAFVVLLGLVASHASAQGGVKDLLGNYYDFTTGQVSSSLTGHVYNTAPAVLPVHTYVAAAHHGYAAPAIVGGYYGAGGYYGGAPLLYK